MLRLSSIALVAVLIAPAYTSLAQERVEAGALQCRGSTTSFIVGSVTELNCTFVPSDGGPTESYMFRISDRDEHELTRDSLNQARIANGLEAHYHPRARNEVLGLVALLLVIVLLTLVTT